MGSFSEWMTKDFKKQIIYHNHKSKNGNQWLNTIKQDTQEIGIRQGDPI